MIFIGKKSIKVSLSLTLISICVYLLKNRRFSFWKEIFSTTKIFQDLNLLLTSMFQKMLPY